MYHCPRVCSNASPLPPLCRVCNNASYASPLLPLCRVCSNASPLLPVSFAVSLSILIRWASGLSVLSIVSKNQLLVSLNFFVVIFLFSISLTSALSFIIFCLFGFIVLINF